MAAYPGRPATAFLLLILLCRLALASPPVSDSETDQLLPAIAVKLQAEYIYPEVATLIARSILQRQHRRLYRQLKGSELADRLRDDLRSISHDEHMWVGYHPEGARDEPLVPATADLQSWRADASKDNFGFRQVEQLPAMSGTSSSICLFIPISQPSVLPQR